MKKRYFTIKLALQKKVIASLNTKKLTGGTANTKPVEDPLTNNSLCPIETCSCTDPRFDNCKPVRA